MVMPDMQNKNIIVCRSNWKSDLRQSACNKRQWFCTRL